jgi:hypothetical protein
MKNFLILILLILINYSNCQVEGNQPNVEDQNIEDADDEEMINPIFQDFINEWEAKMQDFETQYTHLIPVKYKSQAEYYENITRVPCAFRGAFILEEATSKSDVIDFRIIAPNNTVVYQVSSIGSIFSLNLTDKGLYTIVFHNRVLNKEIRPNLMVNSGQNVILGKENLSKTEKKLDNIITFLKKYEQDTKLTKGFKRIGNEELSKTNKYFFAFSVIETIVLIGVSIWQYFYLKHLFEIKGSL